MHAQRSGRPPCLSKSRPRQAETPAATLRKDTASISAPRRETGFAFFNPPVANARPPATQPLSSVPGTNAPPLLYADTNRSPDALYFGRVDVPDPFIAFATQGRKFAVVSALEYGRVKKASEFDVVLPLEKYIARARSLWPQRNPGAAEVIFLAAKERKQTRFTVPEDFPSSIYEKLYELGLDIVVAEGPL